MGITPRNIISIDITNECNLNCAHCRTVKNTQNIDIKSLNTILDNCESIHPKFAIISGGEPLIREDIVEIMEFLNKRGLLTQINTNGTLLTEKLLQKLIKAKVSYIQLSIDGDRVTHDSIRGDGTYEQVMRAAELISKHKHDVKLLICCTISTLNINSVSKLLEDMIKVRGIVPFSFGLKRFIPKNRLAKTSSLGKAGLKQFLKLYAELKERYKDILEIKTDTPQRNVLIRDKAISYLKKSGLECLGCSACFDGPTIRPNASVSPCPTMDIEIGNLLEHDILEVYESDIYKKIMDRTNLKGKCGECKYKMICGGCRSAAYAITGDYLGEDPECFYYE